MGTSASWPPPSAENGDLLNEGPRANVVLVELDGRPAVRKEFRAGCERYLEREIFARSVLAEEIPEIPPLLDAGERYIVSPFYDDRLAFDRDREELYPLGVARQVIGFLRKIHRAGFATLDAHPGNVLVDQDGTIRFLDFEFLQPYPGPTPHRFRESWDVVGPPADARVDRPRGGCATWQGHWWPYVGLTVEQLESASPFRQRTVRARHWATWLIPRRMDRRLSPRGVEMKHRVANVVRSGLGRM